MFGRFLRGRRKRRLLRRRCLRASPATCIFIYDSPEEIKQKMAKAFCPERTVKFNPVLDICKYIVFREKPVFKIERPAKFGGTVEFQSFQELESAYAEGKLHPMDLKGGVAAELADVLEPVRRYFANNKEAMDCLETVRQAKITR